MLLLIGGINLGTSGMADWGWMGINPTPWLLVPLFMGARYGFGWGVSAGFLTAAIIYVGRAVYAIGHAESQSLTQIFTHNLFFFLVMPGIGFLTGETQGLISRKLATSEETVGSLKENQDRLEAEVDIAQEARWQLQEKLALFGAEHSNLDRQLRGLFEPSAGAIFPNLLRLLRDTCGVTDAGIYSVVGQDLKRIATIGQEAHLPETIQANEVEIAQLTLERKALTTIKELWQESPDKHSTYIAALPWLGSGSSVAALLLINRMSFLGTTWRNFSRIQMICRWVAQYIELRVQATGAKEKLGGNTGALIVTPRALKTTLAHAQSVHKEWHLPSTLATFEFTEHVSEQVAKILPEVVGSVMRPTDVGSLEGDPTKPMFKVLMPMEGVNDAEGLLNAALKAIANNPQLSSKVVGNLSMTDDADPVPA